MGPKSKSKVEMMDVEAEKPDDIVDVENGLRAKLATQLLVEEEEQDVKHSEKVPLKRGCKSHLFRKKNLAKLVLAKTCLVAYHIPGIFSNAREPHVRTLSEQILLDLPSKVDVVGDADEAHGQSP